MPAILSERREEHDGRVWLVTVYRPARKSDLLRDGTGFRKRTPGAALR